MIPRIQKTDYLERVPVGKPFRCQVFSVQSAGNQTWVRLEAWPSNIPLEPFERVIVPPDMNLSPQDSVDVEVRLYRVMQGAPEKVCREQAALGDPFFLADTPEKKAKADRIGRTLAILRRRTT